VPPSLRSWQGAGVCTVTELRLGYAVRSTHVAGLKRYYGAGHLHFITCSCYQRRAWLRTPRRRDLFLRILEHIRQKYRFVVPGYVVMPEHFHLLISEPQVGDPSLVLQVIKQRFAQLVLRRRRKAAEQKSLFEGHPLHVWQARFYDFNVWAERKRVEKLRYMHRNPGSPGSPVLAR
jgi:putative transposase